MRRKERHDNPQEGDLNRVVQMPSRTAVARQLHEAGYGTGTSQMDEFFNLYAAAIGGSTIGGAGLNDRWRSTEQHQFPHSNLITHAQLTRIFPNVVDIVCPDTVVANSAKIFQQKSLREEEQRQRASEPTSEQLGPADSLTNAQRYTQLRRIEEIIVAQDDGRRFDTTHQVKPDFYRSQTHRGFYVEQTYSRIDGLWTPWGKVTVLGSGYGWEDREANRVLNRLGGRQYQPAVEVDPQSTIFEVHSIDNVALPNPMEQPRSQRKPYKEVERAWDKLTQRYEQLKGRG